MSAGQPTDQQPTEQATEAQLPVLPSPSRLSVFASGVQVSLNFFDVRFGFGQTLMQGGVPIAFQELVEIVMSPQFAKIAAKQLSDAIQNYEKQFGSIPDPPEGAVKSIGRTFQPPNLPNVTGQLTGKSER